MNCSFAINDDNEFEPPENFDVLASITTTGVHAFFINDFFNQDTDDFFNQDTARITIDDNDGQCCCEDYLEVYNLTHFYPYSGSISITATCDGYI